MIALLTLAEIGIVSWLFKSEMSVGVFNVKVFVWLLISVMRTLAYLAMCFDSISRRRLFMYTLIITTFVEVVLFVMMNIDLFNTTATEKVLSVVMSWGLGTAVATVLIEVVTLIHLIMFVYFCAVAFEYYTYARDDPNMIDAEHAALAAAEKKAAAERKRAELAKQKQPIEEIKEENDIEQRTPLLRDPTINSAKGKNIEAASLRP